MGGTILELVMETLRDAGFLVNAAYPGQKYAMITNPVAAVHMEQVDQQLRTVTVAVDILSPMALGGRHCEELALKAASALRMIKASCVQNACAYDGVIQVYTVTVLAAFTGTADNLGYSIGQGFSLYINDAYLPYAVTFHAEQVRKNDAHYAMGERSPVGISRGGWLWQLEAEEIIPVAYAQVGQVSEPVTVKVVRDGVWETYSGCVWDSVRKEYSAQGLRIVHKGIATGKEVGFGE